MEGQYCGVCVCVLCVCAVSYTHLDVYKRQLYNSGTFAKNYLILFEFAAIIVCHRQNIGMENHTRLPCSKIYI